MPDLNELLRWSIANSTRDDQATAPAVAQPEAQSSTSDGLTLRYNPPSSTSAPHAGTARLHPTDLAPADLSPASTPGPGTPQQEGDFQLPQLPEGVQKRDDLTTEMLDLILGKSDSIMMKEKMATATDESVPVEERVEALDDFEMLIELIDNANNMPILKLWQPLLGLLSSSHSEIVAHACWIIGTAVQNNLKAQAALYIHGAFPLIFSTLVSSQPASVRAKATYALSSALKHWPLAAPALSASYDIPSSSSSSSESQTGYSILASGVVDADKVVRRKMAFLIGTLVMQSTEKYQGEIPNEVRNLLEEQMKEVHVGQALSEGLVKGLKQQGVFTALLKGLKEGKGEDVEYEENAIRALARAAESDGLGASEKDDFRSFWASLDASAREDRGLLGEDGKTIDAALA
ncbi:hypothetical protein IAU60_003407 [Kwoniella sp. DSM 27419]